MELIRLLPSDNCRVSVFPAMRRCSSLVGTAPLDARRSGLRVGRAIGFGF
jgi:hypothetical protein